MNSFIKLFAASGLALATALPAFAEAHMADPMTLTCADFVAMDSIGMTAATRSLDAMMAMTEDEAAAAMALTDEEKAAKVAEMDIAMAAMTEDEQTITEAATQASLTKMTEACTAMPDGTVAEAAKAAM